jgi:hypothetical protein
MNADRDLERRIADFYSTEAPARAPDWVLRTALETIDTTPQRRVVIRVPWRNPPMNTVTKVAIAAVVVIAVGALGLSVLRPPSSSSVGGQPTASPSSAPSSSPSSSPSATPITPPVLTESFTSERYGFSISYPTGWATRPGTDPWTTGLPDFGSTQGDVIHDPNQDDGHLWITVTSQPLAGKTGAQWVDDTLTGLNDVQACESPIEPVTIDGGQGQSCNSAMAAASAGDRGYLMYLYASDDDPSLPAVYDREYFMDILATIQLQPEDAVDTAASPSPS